ncbi:membrane protein insertase YidC [Candidatus Neptunochlamydia vexilliferae]|nr:membrane protein insertase YidC [Candidatus Neptunochlamydia vexilliferae]
MNKRFVIFVLSMTVVLFFVNQYFTDQKQKEYDAQQQQKEELTEERLLSKEENIAARRARPQDLPLVQVYSDGEERQPLTWGAVAGERSYFVTSWEKNWPQSVIIGGQSARLVETDDHFALYTTSHQPEIDSVYLPELGTHDVQVVTFSEEGPLVTLGEYDDGQLFFPSVIPQKNGIVLYRVDGQYLPVGIWSGTFIPLIKLTNFTPLVHYRVEQAPLQKMTDQDFFVLENETMQVVFSNLGGAIAEINLPFRSEHDEESVVLPINFDRIIKKRYTANSHFPSRIYETVEQGQMVTKQPAKGGYYPLLRRGIEPGSGVPPYEVPPRFYAFNTLSEDPETAQAIYKVVDFNETMIRFEASFPNRRIIKTYSFPKEGSAKAPYCLDVSIKVDGDTRGLWVGSGVPEVELISGNPAPTLKFSTVQNSKRVVEKLSLPKLSTTMSAIQPDWISNSNGYFTLIMDPVTQIGTGFQANNIPGNLDPTRITMIDSQHDLYPASKYPGYEIHMPLRRTSEPMEFRFYAGPTDKNILTLVSNTLTNPVTGYSPKYTETQSFHGWFSFISEPFAKFLYFILDFFHMITGSWGFSIILLTVVLRIMMYPLNAWSIKSTLRLQEISPQLQKLQAKHKKEGKKDPKKAQMEMMAFYKENKINPFGGCLPLIIQMPFLFGMFDLLKSTFPLRGASFIPGWIDNLTAPDVVFSWSYPIPFIGTSFHLLPVLLGVVMFFQQKMAAAQNKNKGPLTEQQQQQQKMGRIMTIVFTFLFYKFPSGLNLYWLSSMSLQILQQWYMAKRQAKGKKGSREILVKPKKNLPR